MKIKVKNYSFKFHLRPSKSEENFIGINGEKFSSHKFYPPQKLDKKKFKENFFAQIFQLINKVFALLFENIFRSFIELHHHLAL
jgi:hypothetical protein